MSVIQCLLSDPSEFSVTLGKVDFQLPTDSFLLITTPSLTWLLLRPNCREDTNDVLSEWVSPVLLLAARLRVPVAMCSVRTHSPHSRGPDPERFCGNQTVLVFTLLIKMKTHPSLPCS